MLVAATATMSAFGPAHAQAPGQIAHTWVASYGSNANTCDRSSPCATFGGALNKTLPGGEISCVDAGNFGGLVINIPLTINCENTVGSNTPGPTNATTFFNIQLSSASDVVTLRGLDLDGLGASCTCSIVTFLGRGVLHLDKVKISNVRGSSNGVGFFPLGPSRLEVSDSLIANTGGGALANAGILIFPSSGGAANVSINRTELKGNVNGIFFDGSGINPGGVNLNVRDSLLSGNSNCGIAIAGPSAPVSTLIERTTVNSSGNTGVAAAGPGATVRIGNSTIFGNVTGVATFSGATMRSYKNNQINGNGTDGTPLPAEGMN